MNYPFDFYTAQSKLQQKPNTIAAAATVTPITKFTFLTGTTQLVSITPPESGGYTEITLCFTNAAPGAFSVAGNIQIAYQPVQNRPIDLCWDPSSGKWWVKAVV